MAVVLRILVVLLPVIALILWLRWRSKRDLGDEVRELEAKRLRVGMTILTVALLLTGLGFRFLDDTSGNVDEVYVPARVENGVLIPGKFVPKDQVPEESSEKDSDDGSGGAGAS